MYKYRTTQKERLFRYFGLFHRYTKVRILAFLFFFFFFFFLFFHITPPPSVLKILVGNYFITQVQRNWNPLPFGRPKLSSLRLKELTHHSVSCIVRTTKPHKQSTWQGDGPLDKCKRHKVSRINCRKSCPNIFFPATFHIHLTRILLKDSISMN